MRKGSALLIVLGMLAFMVISAVAFSAYMRYSRLPSSYLRRSSASRLLAKAALAEAIDEIDSAIGNNPHPGIGNNGYTYEPDQNSRAVGSSHPRNAWKNRIYLGTNSVQNLVDPDQTVSTLCLEGLAYIPPALVNDARYYSRRSKAAQWKNFLFDSGRYAFCAIDVSDHLDVNALSAGVSRDSSADGRISLAHLFENERHTDYQSDPKVWEDFLVAAKVRSASPAEQSVKQGIKGSNRRTGGGSSASCLPLVSLADFNLALFDKKPAGWTSAFGEYVENGRSSFYGGVSSESFEAEKVRRQSFITDSYFPPTPAENADDADYDLSDDEFQPFEQSLLEADTPSLTRFIQAQSKPTAKLLFDRLSAFGLATLYDYLDDDNVPVSLAFPSVERIPMIAGIGSTGMDSGTIKIKSSKKYTDDPSSDGYSGCKSVGQGTRVVEQVTYYNLSGTEFIKFLNEGVAKAVVAYPFRRGADTLSPGAAQKFTLEGTLSVFFALGTCDSRSGGDLLCVQNDASFTDKNLPADGAYSVFHIPLKFSDYSNYSFDSVDTPQDAVREVQSILRENGLASQIGPYLEKPENAVLTVTEQWTQTKVPSLVQGQPPTWDPVAPPSWDPANTAISAIRPISGGTAQNLGNLGDAGSKKVTVRSALWLRLKNGNGKTVDLVPAGYKDDSSFMGVNATQIVKDMIGNNPLMLSGGAELEIGKTALETAAASPSPVPLALGLNVMCVDPRWNWAPEHWFQASGDVTKEKWISTVEGFLEKDGRECDMFLTSSDAGYMQSVYELAFLPRWTDLKGYGNNQVCGNMTKLGSGVAVTTRETDPERVVNRHMMWRSYHPFATDTGAARDDFEELGIVNKGGGFKVTPYSDNTNVVMSVFANTPFDWWAACKNTESRSGKMPHVSESERLDVKEFNKNYAFNEMNADAKFMWKDLQAIAGKFIARMHENPNANWSDVYNGLGWDEEDFMDLDLSGTELYDVDRKFLYGYWRECFDVRQQLFLVFVRAEPTMMGGGSVRQTPPALGARAVALVWRDPTKSTDNNAPHQTRVLFYRQFD